MEKKQRFLTVSVHFPCILVIRWCEIKRDLNTVKEQQRELLDIYQKQGKTLENVQDKAQARKPHGNF